MNRYLRAAVNGARDSLRDTPREDVAPLVALYGWLKSLSERPCTLHDQSRSTNHRKSSRNR
jgi:hypothetical protein